MARAWKPQPVGRVLAAVSHQPPRHPVPMAFRSTPDASVQFVRRDGSTGRASYWAQFQTHRHWGVDLERRAYVALELHVEDSSGHVRLHTGKWDSATGASYVIREGEAPAWPAHFPSSTCPA